MTEPGRSPRSRGISLAFVCLLLLGAMPVISNGRPSGTTALTFALWLTVWQVVFAVPMQVREWRCGERGVLAESVTATARRRLVAVTLFTGLLFALSTWAYVLAFERAGTVNAAIGLQVYPLFAAGLEALFLGRRKRPAELAWTGVIVVALYELATAGTWRMSGLSPWFGLALAVPVLWSVAHVILRQALASTPITPNQVTTSRLVVSGLCLVPLALIVDGPASIARAGTDLHLQSFAVVMGAAYYLELIVWFHAVRHIDVSLASTITVLAPAVTMVLAVLLLGEYAHTYQVATLLVVAVALVGLLRAGSRDVPAPSPVEAVSQTDAHPRA